MKKKYIIMILVLIIVGIGIIVGYKYHRTVSRTHLIISPNTELECYSLDCKNFKVNSYTREKFNVYIDDEFLGNYNLKLYSGKWYIYDQEYNFVDYGENIIAFNQDSKAKIIKYQTTDFTKEDKNDLTKILKENNIIDSVNSIEKKINIDLDNDSANENLYIVSNVMSDDKSNKAYSLVYVKDNEKIKFLEKIIEPKGKELSINKYTLKAIIDINNDNKYEIILNSNNVDHCYSIYKLAFKQYKSITSC